MNRISLSILVIAVALGLGIAAGHWWDAPQRKDVQIPKRLSASEVAGQAAFNKYCLKCHGEHAAGTKSGPPLVHMIYEPSHHSDRSFFQAVKSGTRKHHWPYGDMPALPNVSDKEIESIIDYVRRIQRANGIF